MTDLGTFLADDGDKIYKASNKFLPLFIEEVKQRRRNLHWTQGDLATALWHCGIEVTQSYISRLEQGQRKDPSIPLIIALAILLSISLDEIVSLAQVDE